jgi:hypothetical protein
MGIVKVFQAVWSVQPCNRTTDSLIKTISLMGSSYVELGQISRGFFVSGHLRREPSVKYTDWE